MCFSDKIQCLMFVCLLLWSNKRACTMAVQPEDVENEMDEGNASVVAAVHRLTGVTRVSHSPGRGRHVTCQAPTHCYCHLWTPPSQRLTNKNSRYSMRLKLLTLRCTQFNGLTASLPVTVEAFVATNCRIIETNFLERSRHHTRLVYMDLSDNPLNQMGKRPIFSAFTDLVYLALNNANFDSLFHNAFHGLKRLQALLLRNNSITRIDTNAFAGLTRLQTLDLSLNPLGVLRRSWFHGPFMFKLLRLDLHACNISQVESHVFLSAMQLEQLDLSSNAITLLFEDMFLGAENLRLLNLANNPLEVLSSLTFQLFRHLNSLILDGVTALELREDAFSTINVTLLSLRNLPYLRVVQARAFTNLPHLRVLQLCDNPRLKYLHPLAFDSLPEIKTIYLHHNHLRYISQSVELLVPSFKSTKLIITLYNNPLWCNCDNWWILIDIQAPSHRKTPPRIDFRDYKKIYCQHTDKDIRVHLHVVPPTAFREFCSPKIVHVQAEHIATQVGLPLHLSCMSGGVPSPAINWRLPNGQKILEPDTHSLNRKALHGVLSLHTLRLEDSGTYTCHAVNLKGYHVLNYSVAVHDPTLEIKLKYVSTNRITVIWVGRNLSNVAFYRLAYRIALSRDGLTDFKEVPDIDAFKSAVQLMPTMNSYTYHNLSPGQTYEVCLFHIVGAPRLDSNRYCRFYATLHKEGRIDRLSRLIQHKTIILTVSLLGSLVGMICILVVFYKHIYKKWQFRRKAGYMQAYETRFSAANQSFEANNVHNNIHSDSNDKQGGCIALNNINLCEENASLTQNHVFLCHESTIHSSDSDVEENDSREPDDRQSFWSNEYKSNTSLICHGI